MAIKQQKRTRTVRYFDYSLFIILIFLICFGLVMLYSTSSYSAALKKNDAAYYLKRQIMSVGIGFLLMTFTTFVPYRWWKKMAAVVYAVSLGLCAAVLVVGTEINGSKRWLYIGGFSFQPSEIAKIAVIIFLAALISRIPKQMADFKVVAKVLISVMPFVAVIGVNNLSTAIIILGIAILMVFVASPKYAHFVWIGLGGVGAAAAFLLVASYRVERIKVWLHPEDYDSGYQTLQGLYAIGSGGIFGKGLGESMQKLGFVPEAQNDMIFTIICEELGIFGAVCVIALFLLLLWRFMIIANNAADLFGSLLAVGIMAHVALQVILNIAVVTNTIPNTGVILPFISYGGTSISFLMAEMGLALSVSREIKFEASYEEN